MEKKNNILYKEVKANLNLALNRVLVTWWMVRVDLLGDCRWKGV